MSPKKQVDLSISIVSFNTKNLLADCLQSIFREKPLLNFEVIVVDNNSKDSSVKMVETKFKKVKLIKNKKNMFISYALNQAFKKAQGEYFLTLNSDTIISQKVLNKMVQFMEENRQIGLAGARQIDAKKKTGSTCSTFPSPFVEFFQSTKIGSLILKYLHIKKFEDMVKNHRYSNWDRKSIRSVDVAPGSFLLMRREVIEKIGFFDDKFLLFFQDTDLCLRAKKAKFSVYHNGEVAITHLRSKSLEKLPEQKIQHIAIRDSLYYYKKHFSFLAWAFLWLALMPEWIFLKFKQVKKI